MFSIDQNQKKIRDGATLRTNKQRKGNEFDLYDRNIYSPSGEILELAENPKDYDFDFASELKHIYPIYAVTPFLDHHYDQTPDPGKFRVHLQYHILSFSFLKDDQPEKCNFIMDWIEKKRNTPSPTQTESERLSVELAKYGFHDLPKVQAKDPYIIIDWISDKHISTKIAFLNHLGFIDHLLREYCDGIRDRLYKKLNAILPESESSIRKNVYSLNERSTLRGGKLADIHQQEAGNEYNRL